jgi:predicted transposase/invertase (TIGR01784 family)
MRKFRRDVALRDQDGVVFFDKLHFKFLQMPLFSKQEHELETHFDKWIYFLKNLESFDHIPAILKEPVFEKAFQTAELANLNREQYAAYETNLLDYWTAKAVMVTAWEEGKQEGKQEGLAEGLEKGLEKGVAEGEKRKALETARKMRDKGFSAEEICELTGLDLDDAQELVNHLKRDATNGG